MRPNDVTRDDGYEDGVEREEGEKEEWRLQSVHLSSRDEV